MYIYIYTHTPKQGVDHAQPQAKQEMAGSDDCARRMPSLPWTVSIQAAAYAFAHRMDGSIRRPLFCLGDLKKGATPTPRPDASEVRSADVTIDASRGVWARVFSPPAAAAAAPLPVVVYFHGGGFALFSPGSRPYDNLWRRLCRGVGAVVVSVNYRLVPEQRFPAAYDDGVAAPRYLDGIALPGGLAPVPSTCPALNNPCAQDVLYVS
jgi:acetyl esterase/lipase